MPYGNVFTPCGNEGVPFPVQCLSGGLPESLADYLPRRENVVLHCPSAQIQHIGYLLARFPFVYI